MFSTKTYTTRRAQLKKKIDNGVILLLGNNDAPMNYTDNTYHYRQDSTFLYYFGLEQPELAAVIDIDENKEIIFGNDFTLDEIVWMGPQQTMKQKAEKVGVKVTKPADELETFLKDAIGKKRKIHFIPQYRHDNMLKFQKLLGIDANKINDYSSISLIKAITEQRSVKSKEEIAEIENAISISYEMQTGAMSYAKPGMMEREIAGFIAGLASSMGNGIAFPIIFSRNGQTLHNHFHGNILKEGDIVVNDSGAESDEHYASDITRTFPVSGKFTAQQREIYQIVLDANLAGIKGVKPGISFREVHFKSALVIAEGLKALGFMKGSMKEAVKAGAHALFFPHGLGHLLGLDVHDLENFGENNFGYDENVKRSTQFGSKSLRFARILKPGIVLTIEPGIYFIPELIDKWKAEKKFTEYINYPKVESYKKFGGIRIEDDVVVTNTGSRVLGIPIPKTIDEVEAAASEKI
ncbi:MAG: aminopeptidase P family protein [Ignavibacteriales bacterium]|nr:aminopeptidase P family protein [Ignavibacteriales bacterium]